MINNMFLTRWLLKQQPKDKDKIYSLHEPQAYCVAKGKDHKQYEYGSKASIACTARSNIIVGVVSHEQNQHDSHKLPEILKHVETSRGKTVKQAVCDRGYRGKSEVNGTKIILPGKALKRDSRYQRDKKRKQCRRRAAIEPIIGHLKSRIIDWQETIWKVPSVITSTCWWLLAPGIWNNGCRPFFGCFLLRKPGQ